MANTSRSLRFTPFSQLAILCTLTVASCISVADFNPADEKNDASKGLFLESIEWGRLVDVYDVDGNLVEADVLVDHLITTSTKVSLIANAVTQKESLFIQFPEASAEFEALLFDYKNNLQTVSRRDVVGESTYEMVARNAAVRLNFNLPIEPASVDSSSVQVFQGISSSSGDMLQFASRFVVKNDSSTNDTHRGGILIDPTISQVEAAEEQLPANVIGFSESSDANDYNLVVYIPTKIDLANGVYGILQTLDEGQSIIYGPSRKDASEPVKILGIDNYNLLAAMRTGNELDAFRGFMRDAIRPSLLGVKAATISSHELIGSEIKVVYSVDAVRCRELTPKIGDVLEVVDINNKSNIWTVVSVEGFSTPNHTVNCVDLDYDNTLFTQTVPSKLSVRYSAVDSDIQACYLDIVPDPVSNIPVGGILDNASVLVHFDESIDEATMRSMSTFVIIQPDDNPNPDPQDVKESQTAWYRQINTSESVSDFIDRQRGYDYRADITGNATAEAEYGGRVLFGQVVPSDSNRAFSIAPVAGWQDLDPNDAFDEYVIALRDGLEGIKDMSGNEVLLSSFVAGNNDQLIQLEVQHLNVVNAKYFSLLCNAIDEDGDGLTEWGGQVNSFDFAGRLTGRAPSRFTRAADNTQFALSAHPVGNAVDGTAVSEPFNFAGAVVMNAYRPEDFGFGYENASEFNHTVEGLSWSPLEGVVYDENYDEISLALSHSFAMPDEMWVAPPSTTVHPQSGLLTSSFNDNVLGFTVDGTSGIDEKMVFSSSYFVRDIDKYQLSGIEYMPWPSFADKFVWRDTSFDQAYLGGVVGNGGGAPTDNYVNTLGLWDPLGKFYAPGAIPTVALPLQFRFRTYPQMDALSLNTLTTTLMMTPGSNPPSLPMFRVYSAGGQDASGVWHRVQPDQAGTSGSIPVGGYINGLATNAAGDDLLYWAAADFSLEVSRMHSHWFAISGPLNLGAIAGVVVEPSADKQPVGTSLVIEYRGSQSVSANANPFENSTPLNDASVKLGDTNQGDSPFDHYGDFVGGTGAVSTPSAWTTDITTLEDQSYGFIQIRVSFLANPDLGLRPTLDGLGIVWTN